MYRTPNALREPLDEWGQRPQMDWVGLIGQLRRTSFYTPHRWTRVGIDLPERMQSEKVRKVMLAGKRGIRVQFRHVMHGDIKSGDIQPVEWLTNETEVNRFPHERHRQKIESGEKVTWDMWMRIAPPETLTPRQEKAMDAYVKNLTDTDQWQQRRVEEPHALQAKLDAMDPYTRQTYWLEDEINSLPNGNKPRKIRELHRRHNARRYEHTANNRIGREGWREWRVSITKERAEGGMR